MPYAKRPCTECGSQFRPSNNLERTTCWPCAQTKAPPATKAPPVASPTSPDGKLASENDIRAMLKKTAMNVDEIADAFDLRPSQRASVAAAVGAIQASGALLRERPDGRYTLDSDVEPGGNSRVTLGDRGDGWSVVGFVSDTHLGSKHERPDILAKLYDTFAAEGVKHVYHGGNWIEGEARFNKHDLKVFGFDAQINHMIETYPSRPGITTHYVAGDDHEGWYQQREALNVGRILEDRAIKAGRNDLHYLGYLEADVALAAPGGASTPMRIMHGGGGSAYALSYKLQKIVESLTGGEKPSILCVGHYHKFAYVYTRNVHAFMPGCTEDQSIFMRKCAIEAHVGGVICWIQQDPKDGHVTRFRCEWIPYYDRGYYERKFD